MSNRSIRKVGAASALIASGLVAGGVLAGSMTANAAQTTPTYGASGSASVPGASRDTPVTGTTFDDVKAAVKAKYSTVTITTVRKDPDGSYDALGTDASGKNVFYEVSADLKTVTANGGGKGRGGRPASTDTPVAGTTADNVKAAVKAKYSTVTITTVRKDPDGSYDALGTDASGTNVFYEVSADLKAITSNAGGHGPGAAPSGMSTG